ncbi:MAG: NYN domain-containing protein [Candidatus Azobacteroides sp.]|nr:NYN domain-containing protein [Candidatus Azobacteroides sp.]
MKRVTVYVDGFNFYYALKRSKKSDRDWCKFYWIDFYKFFSQFLGEEQELQKVIYFTASPLNPEKSSRQSALLNANILLNGEKFEIIRGKYYSKQFICPNCDFAIDKPEEKRTDVNLSVALIGDCALDNTDILIVVTADSDLVPPIEFIQKKYLNKKVKVYFPPNSFSYDLNSNIIKSKGKVVLLKNNKVKFFNSIMPDIVYSKDGSNSICIPDKWKRNSL